RRIPRGGVEHDQFQQIDRISRTVNLNSIKDRWVWELDKSEMLNLLGVPYANCVTHNTHLYLNVFQKCFDFCGGNLRRERTTTFRVVCRTEDAKLYLNVYQKYRQGCKEVSREGPNTISNGTLSAADVMRMDRESQKLKSTNAADVFRLILPSVQGVLIDGVHFALSIFVSWSLTYIFDCLFFLDVCNTGPSTSRAGRNARENPEVDLTTGEATCSRGIRGRPSVNVHQTTTVCSPNFKFLTVFFFSYVRNTGPSIHRGGRNTRANPKVSLTTGEATCSRGIDGCRSVNVGQTSTVCGSNFIHDNDARNTGPSTSHGRRNTRANPEVSLAATEETFSTGIGGRLSVNVCQSITVCGSNFIHGNDARSTGPFTSSGRRNTRVNSERCLHCGASFWMRHLSGIHNSDSDPQMVEGLIYFLDAYNELVQLFRTSRDKCGELDIPKFKIHLYNRQCTHGYEFPTSNTLGAMVFESGERDGYEVGGRITLLMSFMGWPRYIVNWPEIKRFMAQYPELTAFDRADIVCRIFEQKIHSFITFLKEERIFGNFTRAELPDPRIDPDGYNIVSETMMYGPCGAANLNALCMKGDNKSWSPRRNSKSSIGRLTYVHPTSGELFVLRMLLCHRKGCRDFLKVQTINDVFYPTYRATCEALSLLGDDRDWETALEEACVSATFEHPRFVFSHILLHFDVADPSKLWTKYWEQMSQNIPKKVLKKVQIPNYHLNVDSLQGYTLYELEIILNSCGKSLQIFGLPPPPELIFVYGHGGKGKIFLWKTIINSLCSQGKIELAVASSSIASLLLPSGRTAHSRFKLPLELTEESLCRITKNTQLGKLLADTDLII
nr:DNA helicase [Tanacetum cinerariifolium]